MLGAFIRRFVHKIGLVIALCLFSEPKIGPRQVVKLSFERGVRFAINFRYELGSSHEVDVARGHLGGSPLELYPAHTTMCLSTYRSLRMAKLRVFYCSSENLGKACAPRVRV